MKEGARKRGAGNIVGYEHLCPSKRGLAGCQVAGSMSVGKFAGRTWGGRGSSHVDSNRQHNGGGICNGDSDRQLLLVGVSGGGVRGGGWVRTCGQYEAGTSHHLFTLRCPVSKSF